MKIGDRMKRYEASYNIQIPPRGYIIIRLDGKGFSKYTKSLEKPFDLEFSEVMNKTTEDLCKYFNPKLAYTQSDEISLVLTDFETIDQQMIFDGKIQKIASISASMATATFNKERILNLINKNTNPNDSGGVSNLRDMYNINNYVSGHFDSRVFLVSDYREVFNYFLWRQQDCSRNSISMAHHATFGHNKGIKKSGNEKQDELMLEAGINWNDYPVKFKRGVVVKKETYTKIVDPSTIKQSTIEGPIEVQRTRWTSDHNTPIFTQEPDYLYDLVPIIGQ